MEYAQLITELKGLGFDISRYVLLGLLIVFGLLIALTMIFGWHLGLEITVDAQGIVNPSRNFTVKSWQTEILKTILFRQGQGIGVDELLAEIEDQETRAELEKIDLEMEVQYSRLYELELKMHRERKVLEAQIRRTREEVETAAATGTG